MPFLFDPSSSPELQIIFFRVLVVKINMQLSREDVSNFRSLGEVKIIGIERDWKPDPTRYQAGTLIT